MPRRSSIHEKKILTVPTKINDKKPPIVHFPTPSLFQTVKEGVAFGVGSSIGHRIVGAFMGPSNVQTKDKRQDEYEQCLKQHDDRAACQQILDN